MGQGRGRHSPSPPSRGTCKVVHVRVTLSREGRVGLNCTFLSSAWNPLAQMLPSCSPFFRLLPDDFQAHVAEGGTHCCSRLRQWHQRLNLRYERVGALSVSLLSPRGLNVPQIKCCLGFSFATTHPALWPVHIHH